MMSWDVCRICLSGNTKMYDISNTGYQEIYEKITDYQWIEDGRPVKICYICKSQLQRTLHFRAMSKLSEETFAQLFAGGVELTEETVPILIKRNLQKVTVTTVETMSLSSDNISIKEEIPDEDETPSSEQLEELQTESISTETASKCSEKKRRLQTFCMSPIKIDTFAPTKDNSPINKLKKLVSSPVELYTYNSLCEFDDVKVEIKTLEDDAIIEGHPEKIFEMDNADKNSHNKENSININNTSLNTIFQKDTILYIPPNVISDLTLNGDDLITKSAPNVVDNDKIKTLKDRNGSKMSRPFVTPLKTAIRKSFTLTFKQNDKIIPRKSLSDTKDSPTKRRFTQSDKKLGNDEVTSTETLSDTKGYSTRKIKFTQFNKKLSSDEVTSRETLSDTKDYSPRKKKRDNDEVTLRESVSDDDGDEENLIRNRTSKQSSTKRDKSDKSFLYRYHLKNHSGCHAEGTAYICDICDRSFNFRWKIVLHLKTHNDRSFKCDKCSKTFTLQSYLNKHMIHHSETKPYQCKLCGKRFKQISNLTQHARTHTGEKPYGCKECSKRFNQLSHLLQHERVHTGVRPYSCICGKSFAQKSGLMQHRRIHTGEKPFPCDYCGKAYRQKTLLDQHLRSAHDGSD